MYLRYESNNIKIAAYIYFDLFVSFNKRIFKSRKTKIYRELMQRRLKMPVVWSIEDLESNLEEMKKYNF